MSDKLGVWASTLCLIHCISFPILATIYPLFLSIDSSVELIFIVLSFIFGSISFYSSALKHKFIDAMILFIIGFVCIIASTIIHYHLLSLIGVVSLISAHVKNYNKIKLMDGSHPHNCKH